MAEEETTDSSEHEEDQTTIYDLELHEFLQINGFCDVMKAPEGWFYIFCSSEDWDEKFQRWRRGGIRAVHHIKE